MATLDIIIKQMILSAFRSAMMDSASPGHINRFKGMEGGEMDIIGSSEEIDAAIREAVVGFTNDPDSAAKLEQNLLDSEEKTGKTKIGINPLSTAKKGIGIAQNPATIVAIGLRFLPQTALIAFAASLAPLVFEYLTKPGGDLDLRLKIYLQDEFNAFLSRQTQKDTEMGVRQVIIQSKIGFTAANGFNSYNTQKGIREGGINKERIDRLGMIDHAKGLF